MWEFTEGSLGKTAALQADARPPAGVIASTILGSVGLDLRATATDCEVGGAVCTYYLVRSWG